jgi:CoA:oxalate CoA-transferase
MALYDRERTGVGQLVDVSMLDSVVALLTYQASSYFATGQVPVRTGNRHPIVAPYETFAAFDGEFVLAVGTDDQFCRFCRVAGLEHLMERFATNDSRVRGYSELRPVISERLQAETRAYWIDRLSGAGVPCGSVRTIDEVFADGQLRDREMIIEAEHPAAGPVRLLGVPIKMSSFWSANSR